ncbi:MAG: hypothetical protein KF851_02635 [Pirellulaceae bacterium]|nr:hypothetical protein [Pirellulaceae bacterium]
MSYEEFAAAWNRWCDQGQEKNWRERFEMGHECHALKSEAAIKALFIGSDIHLTKEKTREAA